MADKKAAKKSGAKRGRKGAAAGAEDDAFTSGPTNENIRQPEAEQQTGGRRKRAVQIDLIEDRKIGELDTAAREYANIRDERMELNARESDLKAKLKGLMKKYKKETYTCDGVEVNVIHIDEEDVKVKVAKLTEG